MESQAGSFQSDKMDLILGIAEILSVCGLGLWFNRRPERNLLSLTIVYRDSLAAFLLNYRSPLEFQY
jgi:hypothetical protein